MSTDLPLLVGAGLVPEVRMREAAEALVPWALPLQTHPIGTSPAEVLNNESRSLVRLCGDRLNNSREEGTDRGAGRLAAAPAAAGPGRRRRQGIWQCSRLLGPVPSTGCSTDGFDSDPRILEPQERRRDGLAWCGWVPTASHSNHLEELLRIHACQQSELSQQLNLQARAAAPVQA